MPLHNYGVLKGKAVEIRIGGGTRPHYQVRLVDDTIDYRIAINVKSNIEPSELEYIVVENYHHPLTAAVETLPLGFTELPCQPSSGAMDYIRGNLFDRSRMRPLPHSIPGVDNDLNEKIDSVMQRAVADENAVVYAFGERWGPEPDKKDKYFGFMPGNGVHDIHMNQGNVGQFVSDDGVWQDGGLLVHFPDANQWVAVFLKFQSQGWHTDDISGHTIGAPTPAGAVPPGDPPVPNATEQVFIPTMEEPQGLVRIVAALVNSTASPETEAVTLLNTAPGELKIDGWALLDHEERRQVLTGVLAGGESRVFPVSAPLQLPNGGGVITLVDENGLKVDGVAYTQVQASNPGWTVVF
ncbi:MAG TPA: YukJ family protein [Rubricoccaceae bacterium]|jgi:uncharacterized protein YukJ